MKRWDKLNNCDIKNHQTCAVYLEKGKPVGIIILF
jgi:hypothetical protein